MLCICSIVLMMVRQHMYKYYAIRQAGHLQYSLQDRDMEHELCDLRSAAHAASQAFGSVLSDFNTQSIKWALGRWDHLVDIAGSPCCVCEYYTKI